MPQGIGDFEMNQNKSTRWGLTVIGIGLIAYAFGTVGQSVNDMYPVIAGLLGLLFIGAGATK